jgi:N-acetylglutamate synthase-like GNAT family acetyltransferase
LTYSIRAATAADQPAITGIIRQAGINPMALDWQRFLVAEADGRIIGTVQVKPHGDGTRELASLAVVPEWQNRGVGAALMQAALARETGPLYLTCRSELESYYTRFGFRPLARDELTPYFRRLARVVGIITALARVTGNDVRLSVMLRDV